MEPAVALFYLRLDPALFIEFVDDFGNRTTSHSQTIGQFAWSSLSALVKFTQKHPFRNRSLLLLEGACKTRMDRLATVQALLQKEYIQELRWEDARSVADRLHAMGARQLNKYKFLNPSNNSIEAVRSAWSNLLFGKDGEDQRIRLCDARLRFFGTSSIQELLGCFYPENTLYETATLTRD